MTPEPRTEIAPEPIRSMPRLGKGLCWSLLVAEMAAERTVLIGQHFDHCCAFQRDGCHYNEEYNQLYGYLHLAGLESWKTPFDSPEFEEWMASRASDAS